MSHKLLDEPIVETKPKRKWYHLQFPKLEGKFGFSFFVGKKEVFLGIAVGDVEIEKIVRKRLVKTVKGKVKVYRFDSV